MGKRVGPCSARQLIGMLAASAALTMATLAATPAIAAVPADDWFTGGEEWQGTVTLEHQLTSDWVFDEGSQHYTEDATITWTIGPHAGFDPLWNYKTAEHTLDVSTYMTFSNSSGCQQTVAQTGQGPAVDSPGQVVILPRRDTATGAPYFDISSSFGATEGTVVRQATEECVEEPGTWTDNVGPGWGAMDDLPRWTPVRNADNNGWIIDATQTVSTNDIGPLPQNDLTDTWTMDLKCDDPCIVLGAAPEGRVGFEWSSGIATGTREVRFDPTGSDLPDGASILWDFGDGTTETRSTTMPFTHRYSDFGEYAVTAALVCSGCPPSADADSVVVDPVTTYSPQLRLHPEEQHMPATPRWFAKRSNLKWNLADCRDKTVDKTPNLARLGGNGAKPYTARQHYRLCKFTTGKTYRSNQLTRPFTVEGRADGLALAAGFYLTLDNKNSTRKGQGVDIPMTYSVKTGRYITYWFFYAYDPKVGVGSKILSHEGDWERLTVLVDDHNRAEQVAYFQHTCDGELYTWEEMHANNYLIEDTHPVAYSARGAHASYPVTQSFSGGVCEEKHGPKAALEGKGDVTATGGTYWSPWKTGFTNAQDEPWYGYGGAWGEVSGPTITGNLMQNGSTGPLGPPHKDPGAMTFE